MKQCDCDERIGIKIRCKVPLENLWTLEAARPALLLSKISAMLFIGISPLLLVICSEFIIAKMDIYVEICLRAFPHIKMTLSEIFEGID